MHSRTLAAALLAAAAIAAPHHGPVGPAAADTAQAADPAHEGYHLIFRTGTLDGLAPGAALRYRTLREGLDPNSRGEQGALSLTLENPAVARLSRSDGDRTRIIADFDAGAGNPLAMYFLESLTRDISAATGGGVFYIRNRLKDALLAPVSIEEVAAPLPGGEAAARRITLAPFTEDPNAVRLGVFAGLRIAVTVSESAPGYYVSLDAETPAAADGRAFAARIAFEAAE